VKKEVEKGAIPSADVLGSQSVSRRAAFATFENHITAK
jgi:hypothetical protein